MSTSPAASTTAGQLRSAATRAAVVATVTAAAALFSVLPATADPVPPAPAPVVTAPVVTAPVTAPFGSANIAHVAYSAPAEVEAPTRLAVSAMQAALGKVGAPYRWGATGPSAFDCSGLVSWAFSSAGVSLPRTSRAQSQVGTPVARGDLQPGDLVFFYSPVSHVGIYVGNGQVVHASRAGRPVAVADMSRMPFHSARRI